MALWREFRFVWRVFVRAWRMERMVWLGRILVFFVLTGVFLFPNDLQLLKWVRGPDPERFEGLEEQLAFWGDFLQFNVSLTILLLVVGALRKDRWLRRAALAMFLAGALSGATARLVKWGTGRARPTTVERRDLHWVTFEGPNTSRKYQGYFSGHTSATWGSAVAIMVIFPRVGWVVVLFAGAVGWSRLMGNHHFPSDVVHGAAWGTAWGCMVGGAMREVKRRALILRKGGPQRDEGVE